MTTLRDTALVPDWNDQSNMVPSMVRSMQRAGVVYVSGPNLGPCRRCGFREDRRMGACFECSKFVAGKPLLDGCHLLWSKNDRTNQWIVWVPGGE